tara:strand:+ start:162 stop:848 length:687 start_codon:yes stop_codon:yes gene_type:complete
MGKANLKIDWATHDAAKYACENWHYSGCAPVGKLVKVGAWENGKFIGVVMFGRGATPNLGKPYNLGQTECVELVRIALTKHENPVSRIAALAMKFLHKSNPKLRLIVSFADKSQGHHGGIYQAGNWVYNGQGNPAKFYMIRGKLTHPRSIGAKGLVQNIYGARKIDPNATVVNVEGKHRYLMPLDVDMRKFIMPLSKPYPKRAKQAMADDQSAQRQCNTDPHAPKVMI